ncbi:MAG: PAS domain S-box protein [Candidatus Zixiibacteriota bacterium]
MKKKTPKNRNASKTSDFENLLSTDKEVAENLEISKLFEVVLKSISDAVIITDTAGIVKFINRVAENIISCSLEDKGKLIHEILNIEYKTHDKDSKTYRHGHNDIFSLEGIKYINDGFGNTKNVSINIQSYSQNNFEGFLFIMRDITNKISLEKELKKSQLKNTAFLKAIPDKTILLNIENRDSINARLIAILDNEFSTSNIIEIHDNILKATDRNKTRTIELQTIVSESSEYSGQFREIRIVPVSSTEMLLLIRDISTRKHYENALLKSEKRYRKLVEEAMMGIYIYYENRYLYVNPAMEKITGFSRIELLSKDPYKIIIPEDRAILDGRRKLQAQGIEVDTEYAVRIKRKDGKIAKVLTRVHPTVFDGYNAHLGHCIDVSECKKKK